MKRKRGYSRWSEDEERALRVGVERYGEGKWKRILCDSDLGRFFVDRSNVDLKDKWRTLLCADKTRPDSGSDVDLAEDLEKLRQAGAMQAGPTPQADEKDATEVPAASEASPSRHLDASLGPHPVRIHAVATRAEKALSAALSAAKRRHNGTTGERAQQQLSSEMLLEVWKVLNAHEGAALLRRLGNDIAPLRRLLSLSRGQTRLDAKAFYNDVLGLLVAARQKQGDSKEDSPSLLPEFEAFVSRQFEILCLADEVCDQALRPVLHAATGELPPRPSSSGKISRATHDNETPKPPVRSKPKGSRAHTVEDELMAADVLQMIRGGTSSTENSQDQLAPSDLLGAVDSKQPSKATCTATPPPPAAAVPAALTASPPLKPLAGTITVPEGCGLVSTSVSAALDKATELLNNTGNELLPVKDLLHPAAQTALQTPAAFSPAPSAPPLTSPLSLAPSVVPFPVGSSQMDVPQVHSQQVLVPSCALQPIQGLLPASAIGYASSDAKGAVGAPAVGAEQWYPAYLAWVYSAMLSNATCK